MASEEGYCLKQLCSDLEIALKSADDYDVIIRCGPKSKAKDLHAHSFILRARCPFFKIALSDKWKEKTEDGKFIVSKPNIITAVFQFILRYLYTGFIDYQQLNVNTIGNTLCATDELGLDQLNEHIKNYLLSNEKIWLDDSLTILESIYNITSLDTLKERCLQRIAEKPKLSFSSERFSLMENSVFMMVLDRDDLVMEEVDVWDLVLRWHFARYLKKDALPLDDLSDMKQSIKEFIPLIRIYDISKEDFYFRVYPYKYLLPKDLLDNVLQYHLSSNATPKLYLKPSRNRFDSILIKQPVFQLFQKWICKSDAVQNIYNFKLLFRGTRDGFMAKAFHEKCDNKGATLMVAKLTDSQKIIGGYNPLSWSCSGQYSATNDSFLFQLDPNDLVSALLARVHSGMNANAIYNKSGYGPTFGGGHDLRSADGTTWVSITHSYPNMGLSRSFVTQDYEVFQVEKIK